MRKGSEDAWRTLATVRPLLPLDWGRCLAGHDQALSIVPHLSVPRRSYRDRKFSHCSRSQRPNERVALRSDGGLGKPRRRLAGCEQRVLQAETPSV